VGRILSADPPPNDSAESYGAGNSFFTSPVLADLNNDGYLDVLAACADQRVYAVDGRSIAAGTPALLPGWPVHPSDPDNCSQLASSILGTLSVADLTGDGIPEVIVGTSEVCDGPKPASGRLYALHPEGNLHPEGPILRGFPAPIDPNPLGVDIPLPPLTTGIPGSPVVARMGEDTVIATGTFLGPLALVHVNVITGAGKVFVENLSTTLNFGAGSSGAFSRGHSGMLSYAIPTVTLGKAQGHGLVQFVNQVLLFNPEDNLFPVASYPAEDYAFLSNPSFVDVDGDGEEEIVAGNGGYFVHAYSLQGGEPQGWPKFTYGWHMASPAFGDLDGDGLLEMVAPVREGRVFAWKTQAPLCGNHSWITFHHDNRRTGYLDTLIEDPRCPEGWQGH
jgi:hypothetical protein